MGGPPANRPTDREAAHTHLTAQTSYTRSFSHTDSLLALTYVLLTHTHACVHTTGTHTHASLYTHLPPGHTLLYTPLFLRTKTANKLVLGEIQARRQDGLISQTLLPPTGQAWNQHPYLVHPFSGLPAGCGLSTSPEPSTSLETAHWNRFLKEALE